jgi:hypothetical protein
MVRDVRARRVLRPWREGSVQVADHQIGYVARLESGDE